MVSLVKYKIVHREIEATRYPFGLNIYIIVREFNKVCKTYVMVVHVGTWYDNVVEIVKELKKRTKGLTLLAQIGKVERMVIKEMTQGGE